MNLIGRIKFIGQEVAITEKFRKRDVVITDETNSQYPQHISMQCTQDKCGLLDSVNVGDVVNASFNLRGKEYQDKKTGETKYFNSIEIWKLEVTTAAAPMTNPITDAPAPMITQPHTRASDVGMPDGYVTPVANTVTNDPLPF